MIDFYRTMLTHHRSRLTEARSEAEEDFIRSQIRYYRKQFITLNN